MATLSELITTLKGKMLPLAGGTLTGALTAPSVSITNDNAKVNGKNIVRSVNGTSAGTDGNVTLQISASVSSVQGFTGNVTLYTAGTEDMTAGTSTLENGKLYFVYE